MADNNQTAAPALVTQAPGNPLLRVKLCAMMFLQYAIWGLWAPILTNHLKTLAAFQSPNGEPDFYKIGLIFMTLPIASIIGPFIGGQIADRYFAAQRFVGLSHLTCGVILLFVSRLTGFAEVFVGMLIYNLVFAPTIALTNSICLQHWPNEQFGKIRAWGSVGWIAIGWMFGFWIAQTGRPMSDCLLLAGVVSFVFGIFAFALPHTPPPKQVGNPLAFLDALAMLRNPAFAVMAFVSFLLALEMQWYFIWSPAFLKTINIPEQWHGPVLTGGQICEMLMMVFLPLAISRLGFKYTMAIGAAAWALRDTVFAIGQPMPLVVGSIALHGIGFAFFMTTIFIFTDVIAPKDIKSSAQSLLASITFGCGMLVGSLLAGPVSNACGGDWHKIYLVPAILCAVCCVVFLIGFRDKRQQAGAA